MQENKLLVFCPCSVKSFCIQLIYDDFFLFQSEKLSKNTSSNFKSNLNTFMAMIAEPKNYQVGVMFKMCTVDCPMCGVAKTHNYSWTIHSIRPYLNRDLSYTNQDKNIYFARFIGHKERQETADLTSDLSTVPIQLIQYCVSQKQVVGNVNGRSSRILTKPSQFFRLSLSGDPNLGGLPSTGTICLSSHVQQCILQLLKSHPNQWPSDMPLRIICTLLSSIPTNIRTFQ